MTGATTMGREQEQMVLTELFAYMDRRGIKRTWLADQLGISRQRLCHYEHFGRRAPEWFVQRACDALDVRPERFGYVSPKPVRRAKRVA